MAPDPRRRYRREPPIYPIQVRAVDGARFVVRQVDYPTGESSNTHGGFFCEWHDVNVSLEETSQLITAVAWNDDAGHYEPHVARQSYTAFEWGASGYGIEFVVDIVNNVAADAITLGLGYAIGRMRGRSTGPSTGTLQDAETIAFEARRAVAAVFVEDFDDVTVDETVLAGDMSSVTLTGLHGRYRATLGQLETGDAYTQVTRLDAQS